MQDKTKWLEAAIPLLPVLRSISLCLLRRVMLSTLKTMIRRATSDRVSHFFPYSPILTHILRFSVEILELLILAMRLLKISHGSFRDGSFTPRYHFRVSLAKIIGCSSNYSSAQIRSANFRYDQKKHFVSTTKVVKLSMHECTDTSERIVTGTASSDRSFTGNSKFSVTQMYISLAFFIEFQI
jgi:hypothetical protein